MFGRADSRKAGKLPFIDPGEIKKYRIEFKILESISEITGLKKKFAK
jgi:hypothetical protein